MRITRESSRALARRHLPTACLVSIVVVLQPLPSVTADTSEPVPSTRVYEVTARLCLTREQCGSLTARISSPGRER